MRQWDVQWQSLARRKYHWYFYLVALMAINSLNLTLKVTYKYRESAQIRFLSSHGVSLLECKLRNSLIHRNRSSCIFGNKMAQGDRFYLDDLSERILKGFFHDWTSWPKWGMKVMFNYIQLKIKSPICNLGWCFGKNWIATFQKCVFWSIIAINPLNFYIIGKLKCLRGTDLSWMTFQNES